MTRIISFATTLQKSFLRQLCAKLGRPYCATSRKASVKSAASQTLYLACGTLVLLGSVSALTMLVSAAEQERPARLYLDSFLFVPFANLIPLLAPSAPTGLHVTSVSNTSIELNWTAASGAASYRIERRPGLSQPVDAVYTSLTTSFTDSTPAGVHTYLYQVRALDSSGAASGLSNLTFATSISFTDPTIFPRKTGVKGQHLRELRQTVNAVRKAAGLSETTWPSTGPEGDPIRATDIQQLRQLLDSALTTLGVPVLDYTDPTLSTGQNGTPIRHEHFEELRARSTFGVSSTSGSSGGGVSWEEARLDPMNQTGGGGENPLSRNFNWSLPLVGLKGRAGLGLGLSLSYNSLVWTKSGSNILFDADGGFPAPGFRLGFPVIQQGFYDLGAGKHAYLLITPDGDHTALHQVGSSTLYQATDSSYLTLDAGTMTLYTTDGTRMSYVWQGSDFKCTQVKNRNGNYITVSYNGFGQIDTITDTLARVIKFEYNNGYLTEIKQDWRAAGQQEPQWHIWATFNYGNSDLSIQTNFSGLSMLGPQNGATIKVLRKVELDDHSHFEFDYTPWGQVWKVSQYAPDGHLLNYRAYNLPGSALVATSAQTDCPRFTERHDWAEKWNRIGSPGIEQEAVTTYTVPSAQSWTMPDGTSQTGVKIQVTTPAQTYQKIYFEGEAGTSTGWRRGLPSLVQTYDDKNSLQRQAVTVWTQDNEAVSYRLNPRASETHIYDPAGNHKRTRMSYQTLTLNDGTKYCLPQDVYEYGGDATAILRRTHIDYNLAAAYMSRRLIGFTDTIQTFEGETTLISKTSYTYDEAGYLANQTNPVQHDSSYGTALLSGRGNVTSVRRWDVTHANDESYALTSHVGYNIAGSVVSLTDPLNHKTNISYADSFSGGNIVANTYAYPTVVTDAGGFSSSSTYNYNLGVVTSVTDPKGSTSTTTYDDAGRPIRNELNNGTFPNNSYTRIVYPTSQTSVETYTKVDVGLGETVSIQVVDGAGRVIGRLGLFPGSTGGYRADRIEYDVMGQAIGQTSPVEVSINQALKADIGQWQPTGDDASSGWRWSHQVYDWKGRPTVLTNDVDNAQRVMSYEGCGCAGGEAVTITDEVGRRQKVYSDVLGRQWKAEVLNGDGSVYSTATSTFNALDQVTLTRHYQGTEQSGLYRETVMTYDGYGRPKSSHQPAQVGANNQPLSASYNYNADDTLQKLTDARGATTTYSYNTRRLPISITYDAPFGSNISVPPTVTYSYNEVGQRTLMATANGEGGSVAYTYDMFSRLTSEARQFPGLSGTYTLSYDYTLMGSLKSVTDQTNPSSPVSVSYNFDNAGQLTEVNSTGMGATGPLASNMKYRAWGALKHADYGPASSSVNLNLGYDSRGRMTSYALGGVSTLINGTAGPAHTEAGNFQYYPDGALKSASTYWQRPEGADTLDRAYIYDHVGRIQTALSGSEAYDFIHGTNFGVVDGPYGHSYTYNAFSDLTGRSGRYWSQFDSGTDDYDTVTGRHIAPWEYDADGRLFSMNEPAPNNLPYSPTRNTYDAAGRLTRKTQKTSFQEDSFALLKTTTVTMTETYDGDGAGIKRTVTTQLNAFPATTETTYFLRSSQLGGRTVSEYNASGVRRTTYAWSGGEMLASQGGADSPGPQLMWQHLNPVTGDTAHTLASGRILGTTHLDPDGVATGNSDPFAQDPSDPGVGPAEDRVAKLVAGYEQTNCSLDGILTPCRIVSSQMANGAAVQCPNNDCGPRTVTLRIRYLDGGRQTISGLTTGFRAYSDGSSGFGLGGLLLSDNYTGGFRGEAAQAFAHGYNLSLNGGDSFGGAVEWGFAMAGATFVDPLAVADAFANGNKGKGRSRRSSRRKLTQEELIMEWRRSKAYWDRVWGEQDRNIEAAKEAQMTRDAPADTRSDEEYQEDYDSCVRGKIGTWRRQEYREAIPAIGSAAAALLINWYGGRALGWTGGRLLAAIGKTSPIATGAGGNISVGAAQWFVGDFLGGSAAQKYFRETGPRIQAELEAGIGECDKQFPGANQSRLRMHLKLYPTTWR
jgi:YD repeat-containing protein